MANTAQDLNAGIHPDNTKPATRFEKKGTATETH